MRNLFKVTVVVLILATAFQASGAARFKNADKEAKDREFVRICVEGSDAEVIKALKNGANPNARDSEGRTALDQIVRKHGGKAMRALVEAGLVFQRNDLSGGYQSAITIAATENPDPEVLSVLVTAAASAIPRLASRELTSEERVRLYLYSDYGYSLLRDAVGSNTPKVVKSLIAWGASALFTDNIDTVDFLMEAIRNNNTRVLETLIEAGARDRSIDDQKSALIVAVENKNLEAMKILIKAGTDVNFAPKYGGDTALFQALYKLNADKASKPELEALKVLIAAGADVNQKRHDGSSPLMYAKGYLKNAQEEYNRYKEYHYIKNASEVQIYENRIRNWTECIRLLTKAGAR